MKKIISILSLLVLLFLAACQKEGEDVFLEESLLKELPEKKPIFIELEKTSWSFPQSNNINGIAKSIQGKSENMEVVLYKAEYFTSGDEGETGNTIYFNQVGNKQLPYDFVADSQYNIYTDQTNDISYYIDDSRPSTELGAGISTPAIERSMNTWDEAKCSDLGIFKIPYDGRPTGVVAGNAHPILDWTADVVHAGWMPLEFFNWFSGGRGKNIIAVTFIFAIYIDGVGSDDNNDGKLDTWFSEIYYNDKFEWSVDGNEIDVETVALHETGHALMQGHFGKGFKTNANDKIHHAPRAVMNASYSGIQTEIGKTDNGGHCSIWGDWPNN